LSRFFCFFLLFLFPFFSPSFFFFFSTGVWQEKNWIGNGCGIATVPPFPSFFLLSFLFAGSRSECAESRGVARDFLSSFSPSFPLSSARETLRASRWSPCGRQNRVKYYNIQTIDIVQMAYRSRHSFPFFPFSPQKKNTMTTPFARRWQLLKPLALSLFPFLAFFLHRRFPQVMEFEFYQNQSGWAI